MIDSTTIYRVSYKGNRDIEEVRKAFDSSIVGRNFPVTISQGSIPIEVVVTVDEPFYDMHTAVSVERRIAKVFNSVTKPNYRSPFDSKPAPLSQRVSL